MDSDYAGDDPGGARGDSAEMRLFMRISGGKLAEGGMELADSERLASEAKAAGVDLMIRLSGNVVPYQKVDFQAWLPGAIRGCGELQGGGNDRRGGVDYAARAGNEVMDTGKADVVVMAREFLRDPYFPLRAGKRWA